MSLIKKKKHQIFQAERLGMGEISCFKDGRGDTARSGMEVIGQMHRDSWDTERLGGNIGRSKRDTARPARDMKKFQEENKRRS
jgi:hypothetical protein